ncbi:hypothetical protein Tco_1397581, partial [Tanacetum coccineum]
MRHVIILEASLSEPRTPAQYLVPIISCVTCHHLSGATWPASRHRTTGQRWQTNGGQRWSTVEDHRSTTCQPVNSRHTSITRAEDLIDQRVKVIRCDNRTEFKNKEMNQFCEIKGSGPNWLFDIDALTKLMNYKPFVAGNQSNGNVGTKACDDAGKARMETSSDKDYILLPLWTADPPFSQSSKSSSDAGFKELRELAYVNAARHNLLLPLKVNAARRNLQLLVNVNDVEGRYGLLANATIFEELTRIGYEKLSQNLTFYKEFFSPQWEFLIHTIFQCLSANTTAWNEFSSTIASAIICLATNQKFNFSKYIFESMVKNLENVSGKFFMYP